MGRRCHLRVPSALGSGHFPLDMSLFPTRLARGCEPVPEGPATLESLVSRVRRDNLEGRSPGRHCPLEGHRRNHRNRESTTKSLIRKTFPGLPSKQAAHWSLWAWGYQPLPRRLSGGHPRPAHLLGDLKGSCGPPETPRGGQAASFIHRPTASAHLPCVSSAGPGRGAQEHYHPGSPPHSASSPAHPHYGVGIWGCALETHSGVGTWAGLTPGLAHLHILQRGWWPRHD